MLERQGSGDIMPLLGVPGSACVPSAWAPALGRSGQVATGTLAPSPSCCRQPSKLTLTKEHLPATDPVPEICLPSLLRDHGVWRWDIQVHIEVTGYNCA